MNLRRLILTGLVLGFAAAAAPVLAQEDFLVATESSETAKTASGSGENIVVEKLAPKEDFTKTEVVKPRLDAVLDSQAVGRLNVNNWLKIAIRNAVKNGVPANTIVLMLLFPLVAALIAAGRHIVGLQGFGIFTPAIISVAFLATGVTVGIMLFVGIMLMATLSRFILRRLKLPTLPRMALLLWFVSLGVLGLMLISPYIRLEALVSLSIFPILILILLAETFIEAQVTRSWKGALTLTLETLFLALVSFLVLSTQGLQEWVLINPELTLLLVAALDILIGRYSGLRLMEIWRFRKLLEK